MRTDVICIASIGVLTECVSLILMFSNFHIPGAMEQFLEPVEKELYIKQRKKDIKFIGCLLLIFAFLFFSGAYATYHNIH